MKKRTLPIILILTGAISALFVVAKASMGEVFESIITFPFEQIGTILRALSLKGGAYNITALAIYFTLSISPIIMLLYKLKKKQVNKEDCILVLLSALLFYTLYMMVNPTLIVMESGISLGNTVGKALVCGTVYSLIITYVVLKSIRVFYGSETKSLYKFMVLLLSITAILFTISIFGSGFNTVITQLEAIKTGNTGSQRGLNTTYIFTIGRFILNSIPSVINIIIVLIGINLGKEFANNPYSEEGIHLSKKLATVCKFGLIITICTNTAFNLLQLIFMKSLRNINSLIEIPVFSIIFVLGVLIITRLIIENKTLKEDNEGFI